MMPAFAPFVVIHAILVCPIAALAGPPSGSDRPVVTPLEEAKHDPYMPNRVKSVAGACTEPSVMRRGPYESVQVNVDALGCNIPGDAANEPSIAVDPTDPRRIVIGWRQFDTVESAFRQAGWAYSHNGGRAWKFPGALEPLVFRSDPVLAADADGNIYYHSIRCGEFGCGDLFKSLDGGVTWLDPVPTGAGDKPWMAIDRTDGIGRGIIYIYEMYGFYRSVDGGASFQTFSPVGPAWGTMSVDLYGTLQLAGSWGELAYSQNATDSTQAPTFVLTQNYPCPDCGDNCSANVPNKAESLSTPNPGYAALLGQGWIATDHSKGPCKGNVYHFDRFNCLDCARTYLIFSRSNDGGNTWGFSTIVTDDMGGDNLWQWFPTMSVAPNGRIDLVWNDTRNTGEVNLSELYYTTSSDCGTTWAPNVPVSPVFDSWVGWPQQNKIGDYYDMKSDDLGANVAYAATFNGEQDVYFLRIGPWDCNANGIDDVADISTGTSQDCDGNGVPDECDRDCNANGSPDACDIQAGISSDDDANGIPDECQNLIVYVNAAAVGSNDGTSWANAYPDLQDALTAVNTRNVSDIWVAAGVYRPDRGTGNRDSVFVMKNGVGIYGGFSGTETSRDQRNPGVNETVLSGDLAGDDEPGLVNVDDNSQTVIAAFGVDCSAILDGFAVEGGNADDFYYDEPSGSGGGMFIEFADPTVRNCRFTNNRTDDGWGGAIYMHDASPVIYDCVFEGNEAGEDTGGGALGIYDSDADITGCLFDSNTAGSEGAVSIFGDGATVFRQCEFIANRFSNWSATSGVGAFGTTASFIGCRFAEQSVALNTGSLGGTNIVDCVFERNDTALRVGTNRATVVNSVFKGNTGVDGAAIRAFRGQLYMVNSVVWNNVATGRGGGILVDTNARVDVVNSILWANADGQGDGFAAQLFDNGVATPPHWTIHHSCVQGWTGELPGEGNISTDPQFVDAPGADGIPGTVDDDLRLSPSSPCINAGDPGFDGDPWPTDLAGNPRVQGCRVDMGSYESNVTPSEYDFEPGGLIDLADIAALQICYGVAPSKPSWAPVCLCAFDAPRDGLIDSNDLADFVDHLTGP